MFLQPKGKSPRILLNLVLSLYFYKDPRKKWELEFLNSKTPFTT
jgi:hypothetical protein